MADPAPTEIERRVLALLDVLSEHSDNPAARADLLAGEHPLVVARIEKILSSHLSAPSLPTQLPGSHDRVDLAPPERFGAFRLVAPIGRGGMGEVWRGERDDGLFTQTVAIKLIQAHLQVRAGEAFESERRILAGLEHPNIARLIDGGTTVDGRACLVMEFVDGQPFDVACAPLPVAARITAFRQVLAAVQYAHGRLIAHGDLKPGNILMDRDGRVRLLDFGIARLITDDAEAFRLTGAVTSSFASPARLAGEPPSIPDDVFALGRLLAAILDEGGDRDLAAIAARASADDEQRRYATVPELLADLDRQERGFPVKAVARTRRYVAGKFVRRNWRALIGASALLATIGYAGITYTQVQREHAEASARFDDARGTARYLLFTLYDELAARPDTLRLRREVAATAQHYLDRLAQGNSQVPEVRIEAAQGLLRLADVEGGPLFANMGQPAAARANIDAAIAVLRPLQSKEGQLMAARAWLASAYLAEMVEDSEARALHDLATAKALIDANGHAPAELRGDYLVLLSMVDQWRRHYADAIRESDQAIQILPEDDRLRTLTLRSKALELKGDAIYYSHHEAASLPVYRAAVVPIERAVALYPGNMFAHRRLGHILWSLGSSLPDAGDPKAALPILARSVDEMRKAVAFDPDDDDARRGLDISLEAQGNALIANGFLPEGFALLATVMDERKAIWLARPHEERRLRDYAVGAEGLGNQQGNHQRYAQACPNWRQALSLFAIIDKAGHLSAQDRANDIAPMQKVIAEHCR
ncbi:protein kinase domain-containing protein [Novosphingobium sp.]|uniref:protein kinase domain-containing protein n=1 Tax=Novosphingobium sp. TaxID=1874826 RepID=UPI003B515F0B